MAVATGDNGLGLAGSCPACDLIAARMRDAGAILISPADETPTPPVDAQPEDLDVAIKSGAMMSFGNDLENRLGVARAIRS